MRYAALRNRRQASLRSRKGIAMVLALVLIVILSVTAAAALGMVGSERRVIEDQEAAAEAHALARSAYDRFVANPTGPMPAFVPATFVGPDSVQLTFSDGYAWIRVQRVRPSVSSSAPLFLIRSRGVRTFNRAANTPVAERVFAQYAQWQGKLPTLSAWTSLSGILKNGGSGVITGSDNCGASSTVAGVAVPAVPGYLQMGGTAVPSGSPGVLNMGTQSQAIDNSGVNWKELISGISMITDITIPGSTWPSFTDPNYWPVIYVNQASNFSLPASGRGMLIVKNDLTINNDLQWDGIILVGGVLTSNGNNTVKGAIVTGLNVIFGQAVLPSSVGNGTKNIRYDSCSIEKAAKKFTGLAPIRNSSSDNWASY